MAQPSESKRMLVLHAYKIFHPEVYGGIPYAIEQAMAVEPELFDHQLLVCSTEPAVSKNQMRGVERVRSFGNIFSLPIAPLYPFRLWQRMNGADLVILHAPFPLADLVLGMGFRSRVPLFVYWHSDVVSQKFFRFLLRPLLTATLRRAKAILLSDECILHRPELVKEFGNKLVSLPYPIDLARFVLSDTEKAQVTALKARYPKLVLSVGRLVKYKGFDVLIEAAKSIDATFLIVGEGIERDNLQSLIERNDLQEKVLLRGALSERDLIVLYHAASIFVLSSVTDAETFGIVQLEAMAACTPVVNTRLNTSVPKICRHMREGLTVEPRDAGALAEAINTLFRDDNMRQKMSNTAKKTAAEHSLEGFRSLLANSIIKLGYPE